MATETIGLKLLTAPEAEPVSLADMKARLRVTIDDMDTDIGNLLAECRSACEAEVGRAFITQTWLMTLDGFCSRVVTIPRPPLQSVTSVKYYDADGVQQTLDASTYWVITSKEPGLVVLKPSATWPTTEAGRPASVEIEFVAGYGDTANDVPPDVRNAILLMAAERWDNPAGTVDIPPAARRVLNGLETGDIR